MSKVSKAFVLVLAAIVVQTMIMTTTAAFAFSFPIGTFIGGPGMWSAPGPTTFDTLVRSTNVVDSGFAADAAVNAYSPYGYGPWGLPFCGAPFGPAGFSNAANTGCGTSALCDNVFATSFTNAGVPVVPGLIGSSFAGQIPAFSLSFF
ncbi:hypothetical protein CUJ83_00470 [Methanocella sp. CWC-04]|uniref:Uncharacterized protein n=1 Tax=Methanooceanicella nereidis TaxID=2052831 RepID=A0AAP2RCD1_9EURY|nr:hypothetical protein [Methanocella sp. CWC-04]MCD1293470.1 hypothetical protein [Methanocella sp. CWC-04]